MTASTTVHPDDTVLTTAEVPAARRRGGSRPLAVAAVAAPLLLAAGVVLHPDDDAGAERLLPELAESPLRWALVHMVEPFAWLLLGVVMLLVLPRLAAGRGRRLVVTGGVMCMASFGALGMLTYSHGEAYLFMSQTDTAPAVYAALYDTYLNGVPMAAPFAPLGTLGLAIAAIGLLRARTLPRWSPVLLFVTPVTMLSAGNFGPVIGPIVFLAPLLALLVPAARVVARTGGPALPTGR